MAQVYPSSSIITCMWVKLQKQSTEICTIDFLKTHNPTICSLQETHFGSKDTNSLKMKGWKKMLHINSNQKGVGLAILILDKILL